jgi:hypothetical protein
MAKLHRRFDFHPEAILESRAAADWYAERSLDASIDFKLALRDAELAVTDSPETWPAYLLGTRCLRLKRFPYGLIYAVRRDRIVGIAVAHLSRRPGYWRKRLRD